MTGPIVPVTGPEDGAECTCCPPGKRPAIEHARGCPRRARRVAPLSTSSAADLLAPSAPVPDEAVRERVAQILLTWAHEVVNGRGRTPYEVADELLPVVADTTAGEAEDERHALRYRRVDTGTLYDCACGDFTDAAEPTDEDHRRVYEAHAAHILAARSGGAQDDGLRAKLTRLLGEWEDGERTYFAVAEDLVDTVRMLLDVGPDDTQQDGAR